MQSVILSFSALSNIPFLERVISRYGSRPRGHASTHFEHLMHGSMALRVSTLP